MKLRFSFYLTAVLSMSFSAFADNKEGNYNVPVEQSELVESSNYDSQYNVQEKDGEVERIKYDLPLELTGEKNQIEIRHTGDSDYPWSGDLAKGDCQDVDGKFSCNLIYEKEKLSINEAKTEAAIRASFAGNEDEIQRRLKVAEIFRSEPAGITSFYR